ncbi:MAG: dihydroorotase [Bacteroidetes bacterium]|nr:dihydroorotase [Bacteroidota bacterium]MCL1969579.1 dihydroorotase [Bacteroidota bacterium]
MQTLYKNIRIVDDTQDFMGCVLVENGIITQVAEVIDEPAYEIIPAYGLYNSNFIVRDFTDEEVVLMPAFTDLHAHFRDPGFTYKEDLQTGCAAAIKGGYTAVNLMPNTNPVCSSLEQVREIEKRAKEISGITVNQTLSMTKDLQGVNYSHLKALQKNEILFVTDDGKGVQDDVVMKNIFEICKEKNITIMSHAEDPKYSATDMRKAENAMTERDIMLFEEVHSNGEWRMENGECNEGHLHFCHVSTKEAMALIIKAQNEGFNITCEVTPHHIFATDEEVNHYRVNPPFREQEDIDTLINAIQNGHVFAIATDHAPHSAEDKEKGAPGMIGLELAFPLCYTKLVKGGFITLSQLVKLLSTNPSAMMKLNKGKIIVGIKAEFVIAELQQEYKIDVSTMASKSKNTPFNGVSVFGKIVETIF